jgi:hypothetical protein
MAVVKMFSVKEVLEEYVPLPSLSACQVTKVKALQERGSREQAYAPGDGIHSRVLGCAETQPGNTNEGVLVSFGSGDGAGGNARLIRGHESLTLFSIFISLFLSKLQPMKRDYHCGYQV